MAGLGRRTHYRKHLTDSVLHDLPEPEDNERIAKVVSTRGSNQFDVLIASAGAAGGTDVLEPQTPQLAILPTKFHKLVWVKRNDYVIVQTGEGGGAGAAYGGVNGDGCSKFCHDDQKSIPTPDGENNNKSNEGGVRYMISHILYKDQVKHLQSKGLWPNDPEFSNGPRTGSGASDGGCEGEVEEEDDGIVYNNGYDDENGNDLFVNTNRIARLEIQDSSDDDSSDEDNDD